MLRQTLTLLMLTASFGLAACGGGADTAATPAPQPEPPPTTTSDCDPADPATHADCGTVYIALTDADGDFLAYTVDVVSLTLETANGRVIETLPRTTRVNFTEYVELSELVAAANVPPATYVAGSITLDYADAEVVVEDGDLARPATVVGTDGTPLDSATLNVRLSNRDRLVVGRGRIAFLQLDFDLDASHTVDLTAEQATAMAESFIVAEVSPVDEKSLRVRGPVVSVEPDAMSYSVAVRPFRDRDGDFGPATINVTDATEFEVNGEAFAGVAGLEALEAAGQGIPSIAVGTLLTGERQFTAERVLAGSSVPGIDRDAVIGNIIARDGNLLTIRGATLMPRDRRAHFHDDVIVEVGDGTRVFKDGDRNADVTIRDLSIGQRVTVRGSLGDGSATTDAPQVLFDATEGAVRMHVTAIAGIVNELLPELAVIDLQSIDRRRVAIFDFTGTGAVEDADPQNYDVATGPLRLDSFAAGRPIVARGFPTAFGAAPPDFTGRTIIDYTDVRSSLGVGWGSAGTTAPFLSLGPDGLVLDNDNPDIDDRHYIKQGPVLIDLTALPADTRIEPADADRSAYAIKTGDSLRVYTDFGDFIEDLSTSLDGATAARSMYAYGRYDVDANAFAARKIGVHLLTP